MEMRDCTYDEDLICDVCGKMGAYDVMGDYVCEECIEGRGEWPGNFNEDDWREDR